MSQQTIRMVKQSSVIPYRIKNEKIEVLLISNSSGLNWIIPKGNISNGMSLEDSVALYTWSSPGVFGWLDNKKLVTYKYYKQGKLYQVEIYLLLVRAVSGNYPEANFTSRQWVDVEKAISLVKETSLKSMFKKISLNIVTYIEVLLFNS